MVTLQSRIEEPVPIRARLSAPILAVAVYSGLAIGLLASTWADPVHRLAPAFSGGIGDPALFTWWLQWTPFQLGHGHMPFYNDYLNFPLVANTLWGTPVPILSLIMWPVTATAGPVFSYNLLTVANVVAAAGLAALLCRRLRFGRAASFLAGLLYGFGPYMTVHLYGHADLAAGWILPAAGLLLHELLVRRRWPPALAGAALGALGVIAFLTEEEWLLITAITALAVCLTVGALRTTWARSAVGPVRAAALPALLVFAVGVAWPLSVQLGGHDRPTGPVQDASAYVSDPAGFVVPGAPQQLAPASARKVTARFTGSSELESYLGWPAVVLVGLALVVGRRDPLVVGLAVGVLVVGGLSLGAELHWIGRDTGVPLPWAALQHLPLMRNALPARLMAGADLCLAMVVAAVLDRARTMTLLARGAVVGLVVITAVSLVPRLGRPAVRVPSPFLTAVSPRPPGSVVLVVPFDPPYHSYAMVWQTTSDMAFRLPVQAQGLGALTPHDLALIPAAARTPGPYTDLIAGRRPPPGGGTVVLATLRRLQVRFVVLAPGRAHAQLGPYLDCVLGRSTTTWAGMNVWRVVPAVAPSTC